MLFKLAILRLTPLALDIERAKCSVTRQKSLSPGNKPESSVDFYSSFSVRVAASDEGQFLSVFEGELGKLGKRFSGLRVDLGEGKHRKCQSFRPRWTSMNPDSRRIAIEDRRLSDLIDSRANRYVALTCNWLISNDHFTISSVGFRVNTLTISKSLFLVTIVVVYDIERYRMM